MPSDLYRYADAAAEPVTIKVNGETVPVAIEKGYRLRRPQVERRRHGRAVACRCRCAGCWPTRP